MLRENVQKLANSYITEHPTRTKKKTKEAFIQRTKESFGELGYTEQEMMEHKSFFGGRNLIIGPPDADYIFTAHYDTPGRNGWLVLPFSKVLGMSISSMIGAIMLFVIIFGLGFITGFINVNVETYTMILDILPILAIIVVLPLLFAVKNPHNHNDNTSGCIGVYNVATIIQGHPELRKRSAFILFDNEEVGLFGSTAVAKWRKKNYPNKKNSLVINMDCIADGDLLIVASRGKSIVKGEREKLAQFLLGEGFEALQKNSSILGYLSDHANFSKGIMLSFARRSRLGGLYLPNIHTARDRVWDLEQIDKLSESVVGYVVREEGYQRGYSSHRNFPL